MKSPPQITRIGEVAPRPVISVVIPTYEPQRFFADTIESVLSQDLGPVQMQIAVVDDGSTREQPRVLLAGATRTDRIEFHEHGDRLGLAGNWNRAIGHARGEFVHLLHQDDTVRPGFYAALLPALRKNPGVGMGFCRHAFIDEHDHVDRISHRERWWPGVLPRWLDRISERQRVQCPAAIVRRDAYERLGGFRDDLRYAVDWEMWVRIASAYDVWYEPRVLASYRRHRGAETARLQAADQTTADIMSAIGLLSMHLPPGRRAHLQQRAYLRLVRVHARRAAKLLRNGLPQLAADQLQSARTALAQLSETLCKRWLHARLARMELRVAKRSSETST